MMKNNHNFFVFLLVLRIFLQFTPALELRASLLVNFPILVALYLYIFVNAKNGLFLRAIKTIPIFIIPIINHIAASAGHIEIVNVIYLILQWLVWPFIGYFVIENLSSKSQKVALGAFLTCFVITSITTIYGCYIYPDAARLQANGNYRIERADMVAVFRGMNIGDFQFVYTVVLMIPIILCACRNYFRNKVFGYLMLALLLFTIYKTQYTTASLLSIIAVLFLILPATYNSRRPTLWLILFIVLAIIAAPLFSGLLEFVSSSTNSDLLSVRLSELSQSLSGEEMDESTDYGTRLYLWELSLNTFFKYFFTGVYFITYRSQAYMYVGGHSFILDTMARFGVIGLLLLVWMFRTLFKIYIKPYSQRPEYVYLLVVYAINIAQCLLNTLSIEIVFVYLIPLFMSLSSQKSDKKSSLAFQPTYN